jgi:predicted phosphoribosyltransferase
MVSKDDITRIIKEQRAEIKRRIGVLRSGRPLPSMKRRTVILVDDGIAMGSTMRVSIAMCKRREAARVVVAVPVTGRETATQIGELVDEIIVLEMPAGFRAVAQVYRNWYDVSDEEVLSIMERWHRRVL